MERLLQTNGLLREDMIKLPTSLSLIIAFILLYAPSSLYAQSSTWAWPEDRSEAEEKHVLYTDNMKQNNYEEALAPLEWLLEEAPKLHVSLYIHGARIYVALAKKATDPEAKKTYALRVIALFDQRIEYFDDEAQVSDRKAITAHGLLKGYSDQYKNLIEYFERSIELNQAKVRPENLLGYMHTLYLLRKNLPDEISETEVIEKYATIIDLLNHMKQGTGDGQRLLDIGQKIDKLFTSSVQVDCDFINNTFGTRYASTRDMQDAQKFIALTLHEGCESSVLLLEALSTVFEADPSVKLGTAIARQYMKRQENYQAITYFEKTLELAQIPEEQAELYIALAKVHVITNSKSSARESAYKAIELSPSTAGDAYSVIGTLYYTSYEECRKGKSRVQDKAVYIAAYSFFAQAGNTKMMRICREQFPSMADIFELGMDVGETVRINCWINETVTLPEP